MKKIFLITLLSGLFLLNGCSSQPMLPSVETEFDQMNAEVIQYSKKFPEFKIKDDNIQNTEPAILYAFSNYLYFQGRKDDAVFWYYVAQSRNRYLMQVMKEDQPVSNELFIRFFRECSFIGNVQILDGKAYSASPDPKYSKMNSIYDSATRKNIHKAASGLGEVINPYAFGNLDKLTRQLDKVQLFEKTYPLFVENLVSKNNLKSLEEQKKFAEERIASLEEGKKYIRENKQKIRDQRTKSGLPNE